MLVRDGCNKSCFVVPMVDATDVAIMLMTPLLRHRLPLAVPSVAIPVSTGLDREQVPVSLPKNVVIHIIVLLAAHNHMDCTVNGCRDNFRLPASRASSGPSKRSICGLA